MDPADPADAGTDADAVAGGGAAAPSMINTSTWGGAVLPERDSKSSDAGNGTLLHMWSSEMTHHCGIDSW
jgi:hypothetical protein